MHLSHLMEPWLLHNFPILFENHPTRWNSAVNRKLECTCAWSPDVNWHYQDIWYGGVFAFIDEDSISILDFTQYPDQEVYKKFKPCDPEFFTNVEDAINEFIVWAELMIPHNGDWYWVFE